MPQQYGISTEHLAGLRFEQHSKDDILFTMSTWGPIVQTSDMRELGQKMINLADEIDGTVPMQGPSGGSHEAKRSRVPAITPQCRTILRHFQTKGSISDVEAQAVYGIRSLARRILDLRLNGYEIESVEKRDPSGQRYVRYYSTGKKQEAA